MYIESQTMRQSILAPHNVFIAATVVIVLGENPSNQGCAWESICVAPTLTSSQKLRLTGHQYVT